jgi:hypothetical protein
MSVSVTIGRSECCCGPPAASHTILGPGPRTPTRRPGDAPRPLPGCCWPRAGQEPIDEVLAHRGGVVDATMQSYGNGDWSGCIAPPGRAGPRAGRRLIRWMRRAPLRYGPAPTKSGERCSPGQPAMEASGDETCRTSARTAICERTVGISPVAWRFAGSDARRDGSRSPRRGSRWQSCAGPRDRARCSRSAWPGSHGRSPEGRRRPRRTGSGTS